MNEIVDRHRAMVRSLNDAGPGLARRTLIICNTVDRAVAVYSGIKTHFVAGNIQEIDFLLMHSRFRSAEKRQQIVRLGNSSIKPGGQIVVATQVIEAGVDLSSAILWTEIAPFASLVQRFGRLHKAGEFGYSGCSGTGT